MAEALKRLASGELHLRVLVYKLKQDAAEYNSASNYPECFASFTETVPPAAGRSTDRQKFRPTKEAEDNREIRSRAGSDRTIAVRPAP